MKIYKKQYNMYKYMFVIIILYNFGFFNIINSYQEIIVIKFFFKNCIDNLKEEYKIGILLYIVDIILSFVLFMKYMFVMIY